MEEEEIVKIAQLVVEPSTSALAAPLSIDMIYQVTKPVPKARWNVVYEADYTNKRHVIALNSTAAPSSPDSSSSSNIISDLMPGAELRFHHDVASIDVSAVKEKYLLQVGVLKLTLHSGDTNVTTVNMVTQVSKDAQGNLTRCIINPLEE